MTFNSHGSFAILPMDDATILLVRFTGAWNREEALDFEKAIKERQYPPRWVSVADLRKWGGGTTDFHEAYLPIIDWAVAHGECASAIISDNKLSLRFLREINSHRAARIPQAVFESEEEALTWARARL